MARTRSNRRGIFRRLYSPIGHALMAGKNTVGAVTNTAKGVACEGISGLDKVGRSVTSHANMAVRNLVGPSRRRSVRKSGRKTKKAGRR
jgi:hypothetical protein